LSSDLPAPGGQARPASPTAVFWAFNRLALQGFGGVLAVAQREMVERLGWLSNHEFLEMLAVAQVLPGPNVVNLSLMIGDRFFGARGAFAALAGMFSMPCVIVLSLASISNQLLDNAHMAGALRGMGAVAAGLILATGFKLMGSLRRSALGMPVSIGMASLAFVLIAFARWPLIWVVLGLGAISTGWTWWRLSIAAREKLP
jgi:chromate transporter